MKTIFDELKQEVKKLVDFTYPWYLVCCGSIKFNVLSS